MNNDDILSLQRILSSIKRGLHLIVISVIFFLTIAVLYVYFATPKYTATTSILLDPTQAKIISAISSKVQIGYDNTAVISQVEIIKSRRVAQRALEFLYSKSELSAINNDYVKKELYIDDLISGLMVYREGETYVLNIKYTSSDPETAANRANIYAKAYIFDQINSFSEESVKTSIWLKNKIKKLRKQSVEANLAVQKFRVNNQIINAGGTTINEQQLSNINIKLAEAKANVSSTYARYNHSKNIIKKGDFSAAIAEAFNSNVINDLRSSYIENQQRLLKLTRTLGTNHKAVKQLKIEVRESKNIIFLEMKRITQSYKNEYEVALSKKKSLEEDLDKLVNTKIKNDSHIFELESLEREAESYKNLHNDYLKKFEEINQQESFPVAGSRIISKAVRPLNKSHPKSFLIIGMALILGIGLGIFLALLIDSFDKTFKRAGQIQSSTGLFFLGFFPKINKNMLRNKKTNSIFLNPEYRHSIDAPRSIHAETCRNIKITLDNKPNLNDNCKIIGVVSDIPNEGKSITAANLALFIAQTQSKCLLIDADIRNPVLSKNNFKLVNKGLHEALTNKNIARDYLLHDQDTNLYVLPNNFSTIKTNIDDTKHMKKLLERCQEKFDYVIIDLPPLSATSDAYSFSTFIDYFLLALEWGKSEPNSLNFNLNQNNIDRDKIIGIILNQANMKQMVNNYHHNIYSEYTTI